ncbi:MAG: hypothetical protein AAB383_01195 [Patescibacteria group bacterium]
MGWCFALINGRLAEIFFEDDNGEKTFLGHAYVGKEEYTTKKERRWIEKDTVKNQFSYRKGIYKNKKGEIFKSMDLAADNAECYNDFINLTST